ncbi:putative metal-dependent hydrolase YcfH [Pseudolycoriella hygida]|uniref:Metal-dependent hydrolase YcfH n=1 Tax=Pseudolycoriella hygida TaxID=35572 RepID=A0A9Q0S4C1_9DIPT|nr:putative metal-dependent hydrolase YcfH [Pseudolycoriella hygida]
MSHLNKQQSASFSLPQLQNMLADSHCHLNMLDGDLSEILERARSNGVKYIQTICTTMEELPTIIGVAEKYENIFASCGVHPNEVKEIVSYETIIAHSKHQKIIGIGETGLDYYYQTTDKDKQISSLLEHIKASAYRQLPIIIHTREAEEDTRDILTSEMKNSPFPALIHCFTASKVFAKKMLDLGMYISIAGIVTFKNAHDLQEIVRYIPLDRLLIETDSPYLTPVPMRGKKNEPAFVWYVAKKIAELKEKSFEEVATATTQNFLSLFKVKP